tara:strand:+ start:695 stop:1381 length:687 start_codon:yes stop_codon:yes gene_type:complete
MEIDFTKKIKSFNVDNITYEETREEHLKDASKKFEALSLDLENTRIIKPPKNSSTTTKEELEYIKSFQEQWRPSESLLQKCDDDPDGLIIDFNDKVYNEDGKERYNITPVMNDVNIYVMNVKLIYKRARPYQVSEYHGVKIKHNEKMQNEGTANTPSYPSGHTMSAFFAARICGFYHPECEKEFLRLAETVGKSRIKEGVHFKSDNEYAKQLVDEVLMPAYLEYIFNE